MPQIPSPMGFQLPDPELAQAPPQQLPPELMELMAAMLVQDRERKQLQLPGAPMGMPELPPMPVQPPRQTMENIQRPQDPMQPVSEMVSTAMPLGPAKIPPHLLKKVVPALGGMAFGAGGLDWTPAQAQGVPETKEEIMRMQREMGAKPDGVWGKDTAKAWEAHQTRKLQEQQLKIQEMQLQSQQQGNQATAAGEKTKQDQIAADLAEQKRLAGEREAGSKRFREIEEGEAWYEKAFRKFGEPIGWAGGIGLGMLGRGKVVGKYDTRTAQQAGEANRTMRTAPPPGTPVTPENLGDRFGRANEFAVGGQPGYVPGMSGARQQPFNIDPASPRGVAINPNMPQAHTLYQPNKVINAGKDLGVMGAFGAESMIADSQMDAAQGRLDKAMKHLEKAPNEEARIKQVLAERENVAFWQMMKTQGRVSMGTYGFGAITSPRTHARPHTAPYEREVFDLNQALRAPLGPPNVQPPNPVNPVNQPGNGWWNQNRGSPRNRGHFGGGHRP